MNPAGHASAFRKITASLRPSPPATGKHTDGKSAPRYGAFTGSGLQPEPPGGQEFCRKRDPSVARLSTLTSVASVATLASVSRDETTKWAGAASLTLFNIPF